MSQTLFELSRLPAAETAGRAGTEKPIGGDRKWTPRPRLRSATGVGLQFLTGREREILGLLAEGCIGSEIAEMLGLRPSTVRSHIQSLLAKLQVHSRVEAVALAARYGLRPAAKTPARSLERAASAAGFPPAPARPAEVVVVEPHGAVREEIRNLLNQDTRLHVVVAVDRAESARAAIALMNADVVVLSGFDDSAEAVSAALRIRSQTPACRIVLVGHSDDPQALVRILEAGVRGYVPAHQSVDCLADATKAVARGELAIPRHLHGPLLYQLLEWRLELHSRQEVLARLTKREREVLTLLATGASNESIGRRLMISHDTARTHVQNILQKLGVHSRVAAAALAVSSGLVSRTESL